MHRQVAFSFFIRFVFSFHFFFYFLLPKVCTKDTIPSQGQNHGHTLPLVAAGDSVDRHAG